MGIYIQIGAGAGDLDPRSGNRDGFTEYVKNLSPELIDKIILVEPNPLNIPMLKTCWKDYPKASIYEIGIVPTGSHLDTIELYYCPSDQPHYQVSSINKKHVQKHYGKKCEIKSFTIRTKHLDDFIAETVGSTRIDLLAMDIEGIDAEIILGSQFNFDVKDLSFEYIHLSEKTDQVLDHLSKHGFVHVGYGLDHNRYDYLYTRKK